MARSKKRTRRQSIEVFNFDPMAIAMEAEEEIARAAIDPTQEDEDLQLIPPNGIPGSVALGINLNYDVFKHDFLMRDVTWRSGKINIRDRCMNVFLKNNWLSWRTQCQSEYNLNKAEVWKAMLHYMGLEMHGMKMDWSIVDISIPLNTISREMRMSAHRELYRMKVKMDGKLVEPFDPNELERPRKTIRSNPSKKIEGRPLTKRRRGKDASTIIPYEAPQPNCPTMATDGSSLPSSKNGVPLLPNAGDEAPTSRKGKEKMAM
ncbi:hypothetical protein R1flu_006024 [Riccia fluitans]|uniref:Transposase n=1 Tax=Riccia fluitans TaxID=41844 RepID=A0ABD1YV31_9MARC